MLDYIDEKKEFKNIFDSYILELNELFNGVYIRQKDQTFLKLIEMEKYNTTEGFRLANLFFYVEGKRIKLIEIYKNEKFLLVDLDNNWDNLTAFSEKVAWYIISLEYFLKII